MNFYAEYQGWLNLSRDKLSQRFESKGGTKGGNGMNLEFFKEHDWSTLKDHELTKIFESPEGRKAFYEKALIDGGWGDSPFRRKGGMFDDTKWRHLELERDARAFHHVPRQANLNNRSWRQGMRDSISDVKRLQMKYRTKNNWGKLRKGFQQASFRIELTDVKAKLAASDAAATKIQAQWRGKGCESRQ